MIASFTRPPLPGAPRHIPDERRGDLSRHVKLGTPTAWVGAGSGEVPGGALSLRLLACRLGRGSFMACGLARCRGEAWLKKGLLSSK